MRERWMKGGDGRVGLERSDALLVVDVQTDFLPGGRLAVPGGDEVVPVLNGYVGLFRRRALPVVATRDWHPPDHCSFVAQGGPWPPHCVAGSRGAAFARGLVLPRDAVVVSKATTAERDAYSGFEGSGLDRLLREAGVTRVFVGGLATDYCVLNTVRDARRLGYAVCLLTDAIRAVNLAPDDGQRAIDEMVRLGAVPLTLEELAA
jgi:nicotinamidase/pyrazinamidase